MAVTSEQLLAVERALLAGVLSDEAWNDALMHVAGITGASYLAVMTRDEWTGQFFVTEPVKVSQRLLDDYEAEFRVCNPMNKMKVLLHDGDTYLDWDVLGRSFIKRSSYYQEFMRPHGLGSILGHRVDTAEGQANYLSIHRLANEPEFEADAVCAIAKVHGALSRTFRLRQQLRGLQQTQAWQRAVLDSLGFPVMLVNEAGVVQQANRAAEGRLSEPACPLSLHGRSPHRQALLHIVRRALGKPGEPPGPASVRLPRDELHAGATCVALPLGEGDEGAPAMRYGAALLMVWQARPKEPPSVLLRQLFGLTQAEIQVAGLLAQGYAPQEVAQQRECAESTVRSQIKAIFRKMHVRRQQELVRLLSELNMLDTRKS